MSSCKPGGWPGYTRQPYQHTGMKSYMPNFVCHAKSGPRKLVLQLVICVGCEHNFNGAVLPKKARLGVDAEWQLFNPISYRNEALSSSQLSQAFKKFDAWKRFLPIESQQLSDNPCLDLNASITASLICKISRTFHGDFSP